MTGRKLFGKTGRRCNICGQSLTGYDEYLLGRNSLICVECKDEIRAKGLIEDKATNT